MARREPLTPVKPRPRRCRYLRSMTLGELIRAAPGQRFTERYRHRRRRNGLHRALAVTGGASLVLVGCVLMITPGPGLLVALAGGALIASESERAARALDDLELHLRAFLRRLSA